MYKIFISLIFLQISLFAEVEKVVILGSGPAGLSAGIFCGQANLSPLIIEGEPCSGQLELVANIENFPGFPGGISGEELIGRLYEQAIGFGARYDTSHLTKVDLSIRPFCLYLDNGTLVQTETLIIALGTKKRWLGLPSEEFFKFKGVYASASCHGELFIDKNVAVAGGGDAALEEALILAELAKNVTLIHRSGSFNAAPYLIERVLNHPKIDIILDSAIDEILDVSKGLLTGVSIQNLRNKEKSILPCDGLFVSVGREVNTAYFKEQLQMNEQGYLMIQAPTSLTSIPGVFAAGDVTDMPYRKAITASAYGSIAAFDVINFLKKQENNK
jgi:thioredoxin reductase (NADPH)